MHVISCDLSCYPSLKQNLYHAHHAQQLIWIVSVKYYRNILISRLEESSPYTQPFRILRLENIYMFGGGGEIKTSLELDTFPSIELQPPTKILRLTRNFTGK